jgi:hypothetical protein
MGAVNIRDANKPAVCLAVLWLAVAGLLIPVVVPLSTFFYQLEAVHVGDLMRL